jgi:2-(1,2-epoxy-1,2-dihydrophenyl)acetyl-CoA isomerase
MSDMTYQVVELEHYGAISWIRLNRAEAANALDMTMVETLRDAISSVLSRPTSRVLVLEGGEKFFCGGGDIVAIVGAEHAEDYLRKLVRTLHSSLEQLAASPVIVIAAVHGSAAGAGLSLVLNADLVVATPSARFLAAYATVGFTPDAGLSYLLPRLIGERRATEMVLLNRVLDAATALEWGLVTEVVESDRLGSRAREMADYVVASATGAVGQSKRLLRAARTASFSDQLADEEHTIVSMLDDADSREKLKGFLDRGKRPR